LGVAIPLVALVVTEGSGNLYLTKVAVRGPVGAAGIGVTIRAGAGAGASAAGSVGASADAGSDATTGVGATGAGAKCLKIIRLFRILINPRSNVINPFNISLVDDVYDSTKS
jgi:hypothetical protein